MANGLTDFSRDTLSAVVAGLVLMGIGAIGAYFRVVRGRLNRHGVEIRNLNDETGIKPKFPEYPADKL